jgi:drug/metabolite transporter (DMT)-like permease
MTPAPVLHFKTAALIVIMVSVAPLGDMFLGKGMKQVGPMPDWAPAGLFDFFFRAFTSETVWLGIGLLIAFFVAYLLVLSWADYSYVLPASSISTLVVALLARFVLHETVRPLRWAGVAMICLGVFVVGHTHPRTTEQ